MRGFSSVYLLVGILIFSALGGVYYLGKVSSKSASLPQVTETPKANTVSQISSSPAAIPLQLSSPASTSAPVKTSNPTPVNQSSTSPSSSPASTPTKIIYSLPAGWSTIKEQSGVLEVGYNPDLYNASVFNSRIDLNCKNSTNCGSHFIKVLSYNGGSRHQFIYDNLSAVKTSTTYEKSYLINNKSALMIYNLDISGSSAGGMIIIDNKTAILIESQASQKAIEQLLQTVRAF